MEAEPAFGTRCEQAQDIIHFLDNYGNTYTIDYRIKHNFWAARSALGHMLQPSNDHICPDEVPIRTKPKKDPKFEPFTKLAT